MLIQFDLVINQVIIRSGKEFKKKRKKIQSKEKRKSNLDLVKLFRTHTLHPYYVTP